MKMRTIVVRFDPVKAPHKAREVILDTAQKALVLAGMDEESLEVLRRELKFLVWEIECRQGQIWRKKYAARA